MIENLTAWFAEIDAKTNNFKNADYYIKKIKIESAKRAHAAFNFEKLHPDVNFQKVYDKLGTMMFTYKIVRDLANSTDWDVDVDGHNQPIIEQEHIEGASIIRSLILNKCAWYYQFENAFSDKFNVTSAFLSEFEQPDRRNLKNVNQNISDDEVDEVPDTQLQDDTPLNSSEWSDSLRNADIESLDSSDDEKFSKKISTAPKIWTAKEMNETIVNSDIFMQMLDVENNQTVIVALVIKVVDFAFVKIPKPIAQKSALAFSAKSQFSTQTLVFFIQISIPFKSSKKSKRKAEFVQIDSDSDNERSKKKQKKSTKTRSVTDALVEVEDKRARQAMRQHEQNLKERRMQFDRETIQRNRETYRQNQMHEKRMMQMRIQLTQLQQTKQSFFDWTTSVVPTLVETVVRTFTVDFDSQNLDDYTPWTN